MDKLDCKGFKDVVANAILAQFEGLTQEQKNLKIFKALLRGKNNEETQRFQILIGVCNFDNRYNYHYL